MIKHYPSTYDEISKRKWEALARVSIWQHKERYFLHKKKVICDMALYDMSSYYSLRNKTLNTMTRYYSYGSECGMTVYGKVWQYIEGYDTVWAENT